jgi:uncharacterized protein (TIGR00296 family)
LEISPSEGEYLVKLARRSVESKVRGAPMNEESNVLPKFKEPSGVFVTINKLTSEGKTLRGCIGYSYPHKPLVEAIREVAVSAATADPRFQPVTESELEQVTVEVSVLTKPSLITVSSPKEYPSRITTGKDGLIVQWRRATGLLLPQVAVEYGWDAEEFLSNTCMKAGLMPDAWLLPETKVFSFQSIGYTEVEPDGEVVKVD